MKMSLLSQSHCQTVSVLLVVLCLVKGQYNYHSDEFFTAFPKNGNFLSLQIPKLHITNNEQSPVKVNISTSLDHKHIVTVPPHGTTTVEITHQLLVSSNTQLDKAIHIKTEGGKKVSVYATNYIISSAGGFAVLPLHIYDIPEYVYYAFSSNTSDVNAGQGINSIVLLVSGFDDTVVTITPTQTVNLPAELTDKGTVQAGETYTFSLKKMQTLLLSNLKDLSNTKIVSSKPLSVISGHECGIVPPKKDHCDHMVQQIPPSVTWGKVYMSMPFAKRNSGALYKIIPERSNTNLTITCNNVTSNKRTTSHVLLAAREVFSYSASSNEWCSFVGNKSMLVTQYALGGEDEILGDPLSLTLTPVEQYTDLQLEDILVPLTPFDESSYPIKENVIGIFVRDDFPENLTLDDVVNLDGSNWQPIYSGDSVLGYGLAIEGITEALHFLGGSLSKSTFVSVVFYGFTQEYNGFGYPVNGALDAISKPWFISFVQENYTLIENGVYKIPVQSTNGLEEPVSLSVQTCQGVQALDNLVFDNTVRFSSGDSIEEITITVIDDKNIEEMEMFCLELVNPQEPLVYLAPISQANICIEDDEGLQLSLLETHLTNNGEIELTLELSGYEGETNAAVTVDVNIAESSYSDLKRSAPNPPSFTVHFTKYLRETKYLLPLHDSLIITSSTAISISVADTELNVTSTDEELLLQPLAATNTIVSHTTTFTSQSTPLPVGTTSTCTSPKSTLSTTVVSTKPPTTRQPLTTHLIDNSMVQIDLYIVYLIVGLISLLVFVVLLLVIAVVCFYKVIQRQQRKVVNEKTCFGMESHGSSKANLLSNANTQSTSTIRFSNDNSPSRSDSPNFGDFQHRGDSVSPAGNVQATDPASKYAMTESSPRHSVEDFQGRGGSVSPVVDDHVHAASQYIMIESSPGHSVNGSKDNLLQENCTSL